LRPLAILFRGKSLILSDQLLMVEVTLMVKTLDSFKNWGIFILLTSSGRLICIGIPPLCKLKDVNPHP